MVQKLIFQPLIEYAQMKGSNTKTIDEWFKPQEPKEQEQNQEQLQVIKIKKQENHEIKIKRTKQLSLDKFFG
jgi:hypothetical protein